MIQKATVEITDDTLEVLTRLAHIVTHAVAKCLDSAYAAQLIRSLSGSYKGKGSQEKPS